MSHTRTIFSCRCCLASTWGNTDGTTDQPGWRIILNIDGPNHICPACAGNSSSLDWFREEYPDVRLGPHQDVVARQS